jgi:uncharacterized protein
MAVTIGVVLAAVLGIPLLMYLAQERLIFFPQPMAEARREQIAQRSPEVESVFLQSADGKRLHAWHVKAAEGAPLVLYFGGNAEDVSWMIDEVRRRSPGVGWLLTDYRGYGASDGAPSEQALVADALLWYEHATGSLRAGRIFAFGRSLGSGVAVRLASERPLAGVILIAPFDSLAEVAKHYYPFLPVRLLLRHSFDSVSLAPEISAPLLCLVATADEIIPAVRSRRLYEAWGGAKAWVALEGARHNSTDGSPLFWQNIRGFISGG